MQRAANTCDDAHTRSQVIGFDYIAADYNERNYVAIVVCHKSWWCATFHSCWVSGGEKLHNINNLRPDGCHTDKEDLEEIEYVCVRVCVYVGHHCGLVFFSSLTLSPSHLSHIKPHTEAAPYPVTCR